MAQPYKELNKGKKEQVALMFNNIAHKYDFLNHFLSFGIDKLWRRKVFKIIKNHGYNQNKNAVFLDVATGTGDLAIKLAELIPLQIHGIDISKEMLKIGEKKIEKRKLNHIIKLSEGDSENIHFENNTFDVATAAFGVRNFENLAKGLAEMYRVLKQNGIIVILEFSKPKIFPVKQIYHFYFLKILPFWGKIISKDKSAYTYLPESVNEFPERDNFLAKLKETGFTETKYITLSFGIASIYIGKK